MARHLVVAGPGPEIRKVPLEGPELTIGRDPACGLFLDHPKVSRRHAVVRNEGDKVWIEWLTPRRRDEPHCILTETAPIDMGPFRISLAPPAADAPAPIPLLEPRSALHTLASVVDCFDLGAPRHVVLEKLMDSLIDSLGAERGFIYKVEPALQEPRLIISRVVPGGDPTTGVSRSILQETARSRSPQFHLELDPAAGPSAALESLARLARDDLRSVLSCPLVTGPSLKGVLYLDSRVTIRSFGEADLRMLQLVCGSIARFMQGLDDRQELECENERLWQLVDEHQEFAIPVETLVSEGSPARIDLDLCRKAAMTEVTVLLTGETGTGKEVMARYIHARSSRKKGPFVPLNCAAVPEALVESELFGHRKGSFTGATEDRVGVIELAHRGTLFLDELGELALPIQAKLLRALQERAVTRLGETKQRLIDFRLIGATLRDLEERIREGAFREDLYYRINVFSIQLAPLRARTGDIPLLAEQLLGRLAPAMGSSVRRISEEAMDLLVRHAWPGNIRELRNVLERALVLETGRELGPESLPAKIRTDSARPSRDRAAPCGEAGPIAGETVIPFGEALREFERSYFEKVASLTRNNVSAMARLAGLTRFSVYRKMRHAGLDLVPVEIPGPAAEPDDEES